MVAVFDVVFSLMTFVLAALYVAYVFGTAWAGIAYALVAGYIVILRIYEIAGARGR